MIWENEVALISVLHQNQMIERVKELKQQAEYKDRLLATVSHDLRTPLNGIIGMIIVTIEMIEDFIIRKK